MSTFSAVLHAPILIEAAPVLDKIEIPLVLRKSYAQYGMGGPEIWRAEPSEEVDKAWERVTAEYLFPVKESDIIAMRKDLSVVVPMPEKYHVDGETTYMAKSAMYHNIHCLDYIRKVCYLVYPKSQVRLMTKGCLL